MQIAGFITLFGVLLCAQRCAASAAAEETKTFPGASVIIPAVIGQILPPLIGAIIGGGGSGGGGSILPPVPPVSVSHSTAVATSVADKPVAVSHSGTISTNPSAASNAGSHATASQALVSASSHTGSGHRPGPASDGGFFFSRRWQKLLQNLG